jgi:hypothetical protein
MVISPPPAERQAEQPACAADGLEDPRVDEREEQAVHEMDGEADEAGPSPV